MTTLPSPQLLMGLFAKVEHFGHVADTPFGVGYQLQGLTVAVSFFGHHLYVGYQQAVLVLAFERQVQFADAANPANAALLDKIHAIDAQYGPHLQPPSADVQIAPEQQNNGQQTSQSGHSASASPHLTLGEP